MIPADYSIDDELPINLNEKKKRSQRYEHAQDTHIHRKTISVVHLPRKSQRPVLGSEDHRIRASHSQTLRCQALGR